MDVQDCLVVPARAHGGLSQSGSLNCGRQAHRHSPAVGEVFREREVIPSGGMWHTVGHLANGVYLAPECDAQSDRCFCVNFALFHDLVNQLIQRGERLIGGWWRG
jgi:hypothetical protein